MTLGFLYWLLFLLALIFGWGSSDRTRPYWFGYPLILMIMLFLIGWRIFSFPIHGG